MACAYKDIALEIQQDLLNGKYDETKKLPTEEELIKTYNVSRTTLRKSIAILVNKGFVYPIQGSGYFVREAALEDYISLENLRGLTRDFSQKKVEGIPLEIRKVQADENMARQFRCKLGQELIFCKRLRRVDDQPFTLEYTYYNTDVIPYLDEEILKGSVYQHITRDLKRPIGFSDKIISAVKLSKEDAELLELEEGDPSLLQEGTTFLTNGTVFEITKAYHHYKNCKMIKLSNWM